MECDACGATLSMDRAYLVTTADVVLNEHYWRQVAKGSPGSAGISDESLRAMVPPAAAKSDAWAVCPDCVGMLDVDREVARSWALRGEAPPDTGPVDADRALWVAARAGRDTGERVPEPPTLVQRTGPRLAPPPPGQWNVAAPPGPVPAVHGHPPVRRAPDDPTSVVGRRVGQYVLDTVVTALVAIALFSGFGPLVDVRGLGRAIEVAPTEAGDRTVVYIAIGVVASLLAGFVVHVLWPRGRGRTPAMGWLGLRIVRQDDGSVPGLGRYLVRWLLLAADGTLSGMVGLITMIVSRRHQRVGDMAAKTLVVRDPVPTSIGDVAGADHDPGVRGTPVLIGMASFAVGSLVAAGGLVLDHILFYGYGSSIYFPAETGILVALFVGAAIGQLTALVGVARERRASWAVVFAVLAALWLGVAAVLSAGGWLALDASGIVLILLLLMVIVTLCRPRLPGIVTAILVLLDVALLVLLLGDSIADTVFLLASGVLFLACGVAGIVVCVGTLRGAASAATGSRDATTGLPTPPDGSRVWS